MDGPQAAQLVESIARQHGSDPRQALVAARGVSDELAVTADHVLGHFVAGARDAGMTWSEIGDALEVSKQAVQKRFAVRLAEPHVTIGAGLFSRFDGELSEALINATLHAMTEGARQVTADHLLAGAVGVRDGRAGAIIRSLAPELAASLTPPRGRSVMLRRRGTLPFSTDARAVFRRLETMAEDEELAELGTGHLLIVIAHDPDVGPRLDAHGVTVQQVRRIIGSGS